LCRGAIAAFTAAILSMSAAAQAQQAQPAPRTPPSGQQAQPAPRTPPSGQQAPRQQPPGQQPAQGAQSQPAQQAQPSGPQVNLGDLPGLVERLSADERRLAQEREQKFRAELQRQERLTAEAVTRRNNAEARSNALDKEWNENEKTIAEKEDLLKQHQGNLGELFGVTRQVAGDAANQLQSSLLSTEYGAPKDGEEERAEFLRRLAGAKALPNITELERLWYELLREMADGGKVVKYKATVIQRNEQNEPDPQKKVEWDVVRVGPFNASHDDTFLGYLPSTRALMTLPGDLPSNLSELGRDLQNTPPNAGYTRALVDPASGSLLGMYVERPSPLQRVEQGAVVGWVIVAVGVLGVLIALGQAIYLVTTRLAVGRQLRNLKAPSKNNPLGRVLLAFRGDGKMDENAELAELRISEAVLREVPKLERFQAFLRLAVAAGPLLGLIGTVIGMIITFRAIVASGQSDPKVMAHGIGQAMIATVLGLGIAIPLLFIGSGLAAMSRSVTQILDEQSQAMLAERARESHAGG
jgi:biopolymer transport protein ExbB